ncbi:MAG: carbohydrate-binding domain-containing protein [Bacteroidales bacterium]
MLRKILIAVIIFTGLFFGGVLVLILFYAGDVDKWLSDHSPVDAEILVVEGWVSGNALEAAGKEFREGNYNYLITTGGPLNEVFNLSRNGYVRFDLAAAGIEWNSYDTVMISLFAFGEQALGEFARYTIIHKDDTIGQGFTEAEMKSYVYAYSIADRQPDMIRVVFDNDFHIDKDDRNLHIWKLMIGDRTIPVRSEFTSAVRRQSGNEIVRPLYHETLAEETAWFLSTAGIDSSRVIPLSVPQVRIFRTYSDAVAVSEWLKSSGRTFKTVNIFTVGNHARRSLALYRYALPDSVDVGITGVDRSSFYSSDRLDFSFGRLNTLRQLGAYIYTRVFFNSRWHYKRISDKIEAMNNSGS